MKLSKKDSVALISPSSYHIEKNIHMIEESIKLIEEWGLKIKYKPETNKKHFYLAGDDEYRKNQLQQAIDDPEVKAIFCTRGGYGSARFIQSISKSKQYTDKIIIGFSDITSIHLYFADDSNIKNIHAPNIATDYFLAESENGCKSRQELYEKLFNGTNKDLSIEKINNANIDTEQYFPVTGGCLSIVVTSLGTKLDIDTDDKILLLEDVGEKPYKIDRMLTQLRNAGKFKNVAAIIFGEMVGCDYNNLIDMLVDYFKNDRFPVFVGAEFGHGEINTPWEYGQLARLSENKLFLKEVGYAK